MLKINLYGAPSSGKTTLAGQLFGELKSNKINVVFVQEYAKELVYLGQDMRTLDEAERIVILGEQFRREKMFKDKVDVLITDSPMILTAYYHRDPTGKENWDYALDIVKRHLSKDEIHIWLEPTNGYEIEGRSHTEEQSSKINQEMKDYLQNVGIDFYLINGTPVERLNKVLHIIKEHKEHHEKVTNS